MTDRKAAEIRGQRVCDVDDDLAVDFARGGQDIRPVARRYVANV
jgi:hypothetical protein